MSVIGEWPLQDALELGALPDAVPCARLHARQILWEWDLEWLGENAELIVSELVTNAVKAARSRGSIGPVRLRLLADRTQLLIMVWDSDPLPPVRVLASGQMESGRGLMLVERLARQWDWYVPADTGGKVVWALLLAGAHQAGPPGAGRPRRLSPLARPVAQTVAVRRSG